MILLILVGLAVGAVFGRATARHRPAHRAVTWAEGQLAVRTCRSPWFWIAAFAVLAALTAVWTLHPVRSAVNIRAWRDDRPARLLSCGLCYEENGEEVHPHPECPVVSPP